MKQYKVIQYATGVTGKLAIKAMADHPELKLVGLLVHDSQKIGKDAGEIAGLDKPLGVIATDSLEEILNLDADAVSYMGMYPDMDKICAMLESGKHVAMTSGLTFAPYLGPQVVARLEAACMKGGVTVFGGGISPGYVQTIAPISLTSLATRVDKILIEEFCDFTELDCTAELMCDMLGLSRTLDDVQQNKHPQFDTMMPQFFNQTVAMIADAVKLKLDRTEAEIKHYVTNIGGSMLCKPLVPPGTVGGVRSTFSGFVGDSAKIVVRLNWSCAPDLGPDWFKPNELSNSTQWKIIVEGDPSMRLTFEQADSILNPQPGQKKKIKHSYVIAVMNVLHAIPYLCEQTEPGIRHHANMPLMAGRYTMR
jgi:hypothetical protein